MKLTYTLSLLALCAGTGLALPAAPAHASTPTFTIGGPDLPQPLHRRGADDPAGDDRGRGRGSDDGANHASGPVLDGVQMARRGADDPAGDDRGRGRGSDDGANHA
ncbi:hypothetical protein [Defluviimonas sp. WL0075]|nr:hypothetical protein [Defluviimonas sp. WL0075]